MFLLYTMLILLNTRGQPPPHPPRPVASLAHPFITGTIRVAYSWSLTFGFRLILMYPYYITFQPRHGLSPQSSSSPHTKGRKKNNGILTPEALNLR